MNAPHTDDDRVMSELGRRIATDLGTGASPSRSRRHEQALVALARRSATRGSTPRLRRVAVAASVLFLLLAGVGSWWMGSRDGSLHHTYGEARFASADGSVLEGTSDGATQLRFEGGSEIAVHHGSALRVVGATRTAVEIELDRGPVEANIQGNGRTRWSLDTGPYRVTVVGTVFAVDWEPVKGELYVKVDEGAVHVHGEGLSAHGVEITAGKELRADASRGIVFLGPLNAPAVVERGSEEAAEPITAIPRFDAGAVSGSIPATGAAVASWSVDTLGPQDPSELDAAPAQPLAGTEQSPEMSNEPMVELLAHRGSGVPVSTASTAWLELYAAGDFGGAVSEATAIGIDGIVTTAPADDLWQLADAARISGDAAIAVRSLTAYRDRFAAADNARTAAYLLGRISLEELGDAADSVRWFDTYLTEAPDGPLAEEALGRSILAHDRLGEIQEARTNADRYLTEYPDGTFAAIAGRVLGD